MLNLSIFLLIKTYLALLHLAFHNVFLFIWISPSQYYSNMILCLFLQTFYFTVHFNLTSQGPFPSLKKGKKGGGGERVKSIAHLSALLNQLASQCHTQTLAPQGIVWEQTTSCPPGFVRTTDKCSNLPTFCTWQDRERKKDCSLVSGQILPNYLQDTYMVTVIKVHNCI